MDAHQSIQLRQSGTVLLLLEVLWFALIYSERYTRVFIIRTWSRFCRIIYLLMNSECILIWLGTHSEKHGKNFHSQCRSSFPNGWAKTLQSILVNGQLLSSAAGHPKTLDRHHYDSRMATSVWRLIFVACSAFFGQDSSSNQSSSAGMTRVQANGRNTGLGRYLTVTVLEMVPRTSQQRKNDWKLLQPHQLWSQRCFWRAGACRNQQSNASTYTFSHVHKTFALERILRLYRMGINSSVFLYLFLKNKFNPSCSSMHHISILALFPSSVKAEWNDHQRRENIPLHIYYFVYIRFSFCAYS